MKLQRGKNYVEQLIKRVYRHFFLLKDCWSKLNFVQSIFVQQINEYKLKAKTKGVCISCAIIHNFIIIIFKNKIETINIPYKLLNNYFHLNFLHTT